MGFQFNGKTYNVPGVYSLLQVVRQGGVNLPDFNVGVIIGKSMKGAPYTSTSGDKGSEIILAYNDANALAKDYGYDDIYDLFKQAQGQGAGVIFVLNAQPNTQASATLVDASDVASLTAKAAPKNYGVFGNDIQIGVADSGNVDDVVDTGTATAGGNTSLTDSGKTWTNDEHIGRFVKITAGTGIGQVRRISDNTGTVLTVDTAWTTNPTTSSTYSILKAKWQVTIIPTKNEKIVTASIVENTNYAYINSIQGVTPGKIFNLLSQAGLQSAYEISDVDTTFNTSNNGYKVVFTAAVASASMTTANYTRLAQADTDNQIVVTFKHADWTLDNIVAVLNKAQSELVFSKATSGTVVLPENTGGDILLGQVSGATKGINTAIGSNDWITIADKLPTYLKEFNTTNNVKLRLGLLGTSDSAVHAVYKSANAVLKTKGKQMLWLCGASENETATQLITRAKALNDGRMVLCGNGLDGLASWKSLAPQVMGMMMNKNVAHNLTRDLVNAAKLERNWTDVEIDNLTRFGVLTVDAFPTGFRINQGISTYQDHTFSWNEQDETTYLIQQIQLADYFSFGFASNLDTLIGADGITKDRVQNTANAIIQEYIQQGYVTSVIVKEIKKVELGWTIKNEIILPGLTDFIGVTNTILTGIES